VTGYRKYWNEKSETLSPDEFRRVQSEAMLIVSGVNVYPSAVRDVVSTLTPRVTGEILIRLSEPPPSVEPPMKIKVEHGHEPSDLAQLKSHIEALLREKLIFTSDVELVPPGTLSRFEYKARLVEIATDA